MSRNEGVVPLVFTKLYTMTLPSRDQMITDLTRHELNYLMDNKWEPEEVDVEFFAKGGFTTYTDDALAEKWKLCIAEKG